MAALFKRRPSKAAVAKCLRDLETLWRPPPEKASATEVGTRAADESDKDDRHTQDSTERRLAQGVIHLPRRDTKK